MPDAVNPDHYQWHPAGEARKLAEPFPYHIGTAVAYLYRHGRKANTPAVQDLRKAIRHIEFEIQRLETMP